MSASSIIIAAPASGAGKTIVATAIIAALRRRGLAVAAFKVGPDYIDPAFLSHAAGRPAVNLDSWAMRFETLAGLLQEAGQGADILIGEGVMGLFDGARDGTGSTADLAALFGLPVVLVVDARAMGQSVAAVVDGFRRHRDDVDVAGVVLNRTSGRAHAELLRRACYEHVSTPVLGALDHDPALVLPSRHLGLVQAGEQAGLDAVIRRAADQVERSLDLDRLQRLSRSPSVSLLGPAARPLPPLGARIAVAQDAAFAFTYPAVLNGWRRQGAELSLFSPLADEVPEPGCDAVFLPGGYPELHGATLAGATRFQDGLRAAAARGAAIYGECGGYMVLGRQLVDADGCGHTMTGLLPVITSFATAGLQLGYRRIELLADGPLGRRGEAYRGHEFHYAREIERAGPGLFRAVGADGVPLPEQGCLAGRVMGSFLHLIDRAAPAERVSPRA